MIIWSDVKGFFEILISFVCIYSHLQESFFFALFTKMLKYQRWRGCVFAFICFLLYIFLLYTLPYIFFHPFSFKRSLSYAVFYIPLLFAAIALFFTIIFLLDVNCDSREAFTILWKLNFVVGATGHFKDPRENRIRSVQDTTLQSASRKA